MSHYQLFLLETLGLPRNHHSIYIPTIPFPQSPVTNPQTTNLITSPSSPLKNITGYIYQVSGNIQNGMTYAHKPSLSSPEEQPDFLSLTLLGNITIVDYDNGKVLQICERLPAPKKQFKGPKRLFPAEKVRRCQEWTEEVIGVLRKEGILVDVKGV